MESMKRNLLFLLFILSTGLVNAAGGYDAKQCLTTDFEASTLGKGALFGLLKHDLSISKKDCVLTIKEKKYFVLETMWSVDICREPIHLKNEQFKSTSVYKKERKCSDDSANDFCKKTDQLLDVIRDVGLIFAQGNRQSLESDHGKTYCTYLLLKEYLISDSVFTSDQEIVYIGGLESSAPAPQADFGSSDEGEAMMDVEPLKPVVDPQAIEDMELEREIQAAEKSQIDTDTMEDSNDSVEPSGSF